VRINDLEENKVYVRIDDESSKAILYKISNGDLLYGDLLFRFNQISEWDLSKAEYNEVSKWKFREYDEDLSNKFIEWLKQVDGKFKYMAVDKCGILVFATEKMKYVAVFGWRTNYHLNHGYELEDTAIELDISLFGISNPFTFDDGCMLISNIVRKVTY